MKIADVVKKIIFQYFDVPFTDDFVNISTMSNKRYFNQIIELNNFINNVCNF